MLKDRAQQFIEKTRQARDKGEQPSPIVLAANPYFAIVDGELVNVLGTTDVPGMSPAYWCSDNDEGHSAPVSFLEARIFTTAQQALQYREATRSGTRR